MVRVINVKQDMPNVDYAIYLCDKEIDYAKILKDKAIIIIHGYGSNGVGGLIKEGLTQHLSQLKKHKKIKDFVPGELWADTNPSKEYMCKLCPDLIVNSNLQNLNSGVTVILV